MSLEVPPLVASGGTVARRATVVTDASYSTHSRIGTWAAWVLLAGADAPLLQSGRFSLDVPGSTQAEIWAAGLGIAAAMRAGATEVELHADSMSVVLGHNDPSNPNARTWEAVLRQLGGLGLPLPRIAVRHVRGHTAKADEISLANDWCDATAKAERRAAEAELWPELAGPGPARRLQARAFLGLSRCGLTGLAGWALDVRVAGQPAPLRSGGTFDVDTPSLGEAAAAAAAEAVVQAVSAGARHVTLHANIRELVHGINRTQGEAAEAWRQALDRSLSACGLPRPEVLVAKSLIQAEDGPAWARKALAQVQKEAQAQLRAARAAAEARPPAPVLEPDAP